MGKPEPKESVSVRISISTLERAKEIARLESRPVSNVLSVVLDATFPKSLAEFRKSVDRLKK